MLEGGAFEDMSQARGENVSYIEGYYNRARRHSASGYKTPAEFECDINLKQKGEVARGLRPENLTSSVPSWIKAVARERSALTAHLRRAIPSCYHAGLF